MRSLALLLPLIVPNAYGQGLVSHAPQNCTVLIEQFTGVMNNYAPPTNMSVEAIESAQPGQVVIVRVHTTIFSIPIGSDPDLGNPWADDLATNFSLFFLPSAMVNRTAVSGSVVLTTGSVVGASDQALALASPVNLGLASTFNSNTRELTVTVELYYTADDTGGSDRISVLVKEDHITADQNSTSGIITDYDHLHVLRAYVTEIWGDDALSPDAGSTVVRTYSYVLPQEFDEAHCSVVAFIGEHQSVIYQAREVAAVGGTTVSVPEPTAQDNKLFTARIVNDHLELVLGDGITKEVEIALMDASGRAIHEWRYTPASPRTLLSIDDIAPGIYLCSIRSGLHHGAQRLVMQRW